MVGPRSSTSVLGILIWTTRWDGVVSTGGLVFCFRKDEKGEERRGVLVFSHTKTSGLYTSDPNLFPTTVVKEPTGSTIESYSKRGVQVAEVRIKSWSWVDSQRKEYWIWLKVQMNLWLWWNWEPPLQTPLCLNLETLDSRIFLQINRVLTPLIFQVLVSRT